MMDLRKKFIAARDVHRKNKSALAAARAKLESKLAAEKAAVKSSGGTKSSARKAFKDAQAKFKGMGGIVTKSMTMADAEAAKTAQADAKTRKAFKDAQAKFKGMGGI